MGGRGDGAIIAKMLEASERIADAIVYKAAPRISKTHHEFPHKIKNHWIQHEDQQLAYEFDKIGPAARCTPAHTDRNTTAEHPTPDEIAAHIARTGWAIDPITLRSHTTDAGREIPRRTMSEATATAPDDPWVFRSRAGLSANFRDYIEKGIPLDRLESIGPINPHYNCHAYTFSRHGEAGWLAGSLVDDILLHNGFRRVADVGSAVPGDVVIYRNAGSVAQAGDAVYREISSDKIEANRKPPRVAHSGVVASVTSGEIYVESKLGALSIVRHRLDELTEMYGSDVTIYRTERPDGRFLTPVENSEEASPPWPPSPSSHDS